MDETRRAGARARYAGMDTAVLERMWVGEERVDWADAALRDELLARDIDPDALSGRAGSERAASGHERLQPQALPRGERPQGAQRFVRQVVHTLGGLALIATCVIWWQRPSRPAPAVSVMEGIGTPEPTGPTADELRRQAVTQVRSSLLAWWNTIQAIERAAREGEQVSPWDVSLYMTALQRDAMARRVLGWRVEISSRIASNDTLIADLDREARPLPPELREQFMRTVVAPAHAYVEADAQRMAFERKQLGLMDSLAALAAKDPPAIDPKTGRAAFSAGAASGYTDLLHQYNALDVGFADATAASDKAYQHLLDESKLTIGNLGQ